MQREICERIAQVLAAGEVTDWRGYEALAHLKLPGPNYLEVLKALHGCLWPKLYVEIGVPSGKSLRMAHPNTQCIAIDKVHNAMLAQQVNWVMVWQDSDYFFENKGETARGFDLAFIDGDHSFEQVLRDFNNLEALAKPSSIICLHDVIPMDERTAQPEEDNKADFHTGEVWRLMQAIVAERHDLLAFTIACPPSGLGIVAKFSDAFSIEKEHWPARASEYAREPFPHDWNRQVRLLRIVPNTADAILAALNEKAA